MQSRHDDYDGSNIFWPGYVDATTNLVLNLLFLLTVMIVAVFMFALELGRTAKIEVVNSPVVSTIENVAEANRATEDLTKENAELKHDIEQLKKQHEELSSSKKEAESVTRENKELKRKIERLEGILTLKSAKVVEPGGSKKYVEASSTLTKPKHGLDKTLASDFEVMVRFKDKAIAFTDDERIGLLDSLKPIIKKGGATVFVEVPAGFSEAKRMGFYRAMAVRNLLIEMEVPKENIEVIVVDGNRNANASQVKVRAR